MRIREVLAGGLVVGLAVLAGCSSSGSKDRRYDVYADGRYYEKQDTDGYHDFFYYQQAQVYYSPQTKVYYWQDRGNWRNGRNLPGNYRIDRNRYVTVRGKNDAPWVRDDRRGDNRGGTDRWNDGGRYEDDRRGDGRYGDGRRDPYRHDHN